MLDNFLTVVIKYLTKRLREELVSLGPQETVYRNREGHGSVNVVHRSWEGHGSVKSHIQSGNTERQCWCKVQNPKISFFFFFEMALTDMPRGVFLN